MTSCTKVFVVVGQDGDSTPLWFDGVIPAAWWLEERPKGQGVWVWEVDQGWRHPNNKEWGKIVINGNPLEVSDKQVNLSEWIAAKPEAQI